jgi:hypothetical protein
MLYNPTMAISNAFLDDRITATEAAIVAYEAAITSLTANPTLSYSLDTGQGKQSVTRQDLAKLQEGLDGLYERLENLCTRRNGGGSTVMRPAY